MKTKVYAVAETVPEWDRDGIQAGVVYPVSEDHGATFYFPARYKFAVGAWDDEERNWTRLELPDVDARDVAALIEAAEWAAETLSNFGGTEAERAAHEWVSEVLHKIKGDE